MIRRVFRKINNLYKYFYYCIYLYKFKSKELQKDHVLLECDGHIHASKYGTIAIFAHYDHNGFVHDYVKYYLESLNKAGIDIVFVSSAPGLTLAACDGIRHTCCKIIIRRNVGYDFASWKVGLDHLDMDLYENLILCNDSVFGPIFDLKEAFEKMHESIYDAWSMTDSYSVFHHMQSYFMFFNKSVWKSRVFKNFWDTYRYVEDKFFVVWNGELKLSRQLDKAGFAIGAYCDFRDIELNPTIENILLIINNRRALNPTHFFWKSLLINNRLPFVKKELLRDNPVGMRGLSFLKTFIDDHTAYEYQMIEDTLSDHAK